MKHDGNAVFIGVDFGGTTIAAGAVAEQDIIALKTVPAHCERSPGEILETMAGVIRDVSAGHTVGGVGIGIPCPGGPGVNRLINIENLPALEGYPLRPLLEERLGTPVVMENDAKCMAFGEFRVGALRGCGDCVCVTLGTGFGCGIIVDGAIYRGKRGFSGEIWNIPWDDDHLLEDTANIGGLKRIIRDMTGEEIEPHVLHGRFLDGDVLAAKVFDRYGEKVGSILVMLLSVLDPERIAVGGGLSNAYDAFSGGMRRIVEQSWGKEGADRIVRAELSDRAAVLGAVELAKMLIA